MSNTAEVTDPKVLYADSLPSSFTQEDLKALFQEFGLVSANFKKHKEGTQTGFGFVTMESAEAAETAMKQLHGKQVKDQTIRVMPCKSLTSKTNLYIEGLPETWDEQELRQKYEQFGEVTQAKLLYDKEDPSKKTGVAFVHFANGADAMKALQQTNKTIPEGSSRPLAVRLARTTKNRNQGGQWGYGQGYGGWGRGGYGGWRGGRGRGRGRGRGGYGYGQGWGQQWGGYGNWGYQGGYGMGRGGYGYQGGFDYAPY